ncbi:putative ribonuclease H-like domain-containing protein, partial [Tanacetum coccineum]
MHKKYCLVVTDDYSRFTWVFFLTTKDETSEILKNFIKEIENLVDKKVKIIRSDNGIEFKNKVMDNFCKEKGIKREYSVAKTSQQNGVAERRNRTLIKAARTMLADSKLPTTFWAEVVMLETRKVSVTSKVVIVLARRDNKPPMLEKHLYYSWKSIMELYMMNRPHGRMILASVEKGPLVWPSITEDGVTRLKEYVELTPAEAIQADCDIKAITIILQGLPTEIYALVSQHRVAKDLWEK